MLASDLFESKLTEFAPSKGFGGNDGPSKIVQIVDRLLKAGNKVDCMVLGARGHVVKADLTDNNWGNGGLHMKKYNKPHAKSGLFRPFVTADDDKYEVVPVGPKHYAIKDVWPEEFNEDWKDVAKLAAIPAIAGAAAVGGQYLDDRQPHVDIGGRQVMVVDNPGWGTIPSNAMTLTGKDGREYQVWKSSGKGTSQWLATPAETVKESMCAKHISPSGAETTMCPDDDDYEINYGKDSGIADFRKKQGLDVRTGKKVKEVSEQRVKIISGPSMYVGKTGVLGTPQAHHAKPGYVLVNLDHAAGSVLLPKKAVKLQGVAEEANPCWKGYKQIGMKQKGGKKVPNCVPKEDVEEGIKGKVAAGLTAAALAANPVPAKAAPSVAGVIASQAAARNAAAARAQPSAPATVKREKAPRWSEILKQITDNPSVLLPKKK